MNADAASVSVANDISGQAHAIAAQACEQLLSGNRELAERFGSAAGELWEDHLKQRLLELEAALTADDYRLFSARLAWSRSAMQARGLTAVDLDNSLVALRAAIAAQLSDESARTALAFIDQAQDALTSSATNNLEPFLDAGVPSEKLALQYLQTVAAGNVLAGMQLVIDAFEHGLPVRDTFLRVLLPAQKEVGRLWHLNQLSVVEEHLVTQTTQRLMVTLADRSPRRPDNGLTAVAGAVAGNIHDIGIRAIAYLLELDGWRTIYLGSDIPHVELPGALDAFEADVLLLSVALTSQLHSTATSINAIREQCVRPIKVLVGGNGLGEHESLWQEIGADGFAADADSALLAAKQLAQGGHTV